MRISDWSSDLCSSDLAGLGADGALRVGDVVGELHLLAELEHRLGVLDDLGIQGLRHLVATLDRVVGREAAGIGAHQDRVQIRSEEHTSELQSLMRISYAVFCLKKKKIQSIYS